MSLPSHIAGALQHFFNDLPDSIHAHAIIVTDTPDKHIRLYCRTCRHDWPFDVRFAPIDSRLIDRIFAAIGTCIGGMYKPIPNTPWFTYGKPAQYPAP